MKLNRESAYGIEGLLVMGTAPPGKVMLLSDIAASAGVPKTFLAKIYQKFTRHGIVRSFRGATRGYALARQPDEIKLKDILLAIEGPGLFERCIFWSERCSETNPCPLHNRWKQSSQQFIEALMERTTLYDLIHNTPIEAEAGACQSVQGTAMRWSSKE
jgi:Rrf2 family iron-sulfur cluster assembly transcriptional regulator